MRHDRIDDVSASRTWRYVTVANFDHGDVIPPTLKLLHQTQTARYNISKAERTDTRANAHTNQQTNRFRKSERFSLSNRGDVHYFVLVSSRPTESTGSWHYRIGKSRKPSITKKERQAYVERRKENNILILPANKGKEQVKKDTGEYEHIVTTLLSDDNTSDKLNKYPIPKNIVSIIKKLKVEDKITDRKGYICIN